MCLSYNSSSSSKIFETNYLGGQPVNKKANKEKISLRRICEIRKLKDSETKKFEKNNWEEQTRQNTYRQADLRLQLKQAKDDNCKKRKMNMGNLV